MNFRMKNEEWDFNGCGWGGMLNRLVGQRNAVLEKRGGQRHGRLQTKLEIQAFYGRGFRGFPATVQDLRFWLFAYFCPKSGIMQQLVIPVEDKVALKWGKASPAQRTQIIQLFTRIIEQEDWQTLSPERFARLLDRASDQAAAHGLTPEILAEILNDN